MKKYHSMAIVTDVTTRTDIIDAVFKQMQLFRIDIEYNFVKREVEKILDREKFGNPMPEFVYNPHYDAGMQVAIL